MTENGNVIKKSGSGKVTVRIMRRDACKGCNACGMFGSHLDLIVDDIAGTKVGDTVEIDIKASPERTFAFIAYIIPLVFMIAGLIIGVLARIHELYIVLIAVTMLIAGFIAAFFVDRKLVRKKKLNPVITKILDKENGNG